MEIILTYETTLVARTVILYNTPELACLHTELHIEIQRLMILLKKDSVVKEFHIYKEFRNCLVLHIQANYMLATYQLASCYVWIGIWAPLRMCDPYRLRLGIGTVVFFRYLNNAFDMHPCHNESFFNFQWYKFVEFQNICKIHKICFPQKGYPMVCS